MAASPLPSPAPRTYSLLLGAFLFAIYAATAARTIYAGDSGELVAAVHVLGIPHPPGYPLYVLLGKLFTVLVPLGSIAFRMSLFSAACAAAAGAALYALLCREGVRRSAALCAALLFAFAPSVWAEANIQRVYALNALCLALATAAAFSWYRTRRPRDLVLAALVCGVGATNHTFMAVYAVAIAAFVLLTDPRILRRPPTLLAAVGAGLFGLLPYAFLPLRARMDPALNWGRPDTLERFFAVVFRREYWGRRYLEGASDLVPIVLDYARGLAVELGVAGVVLVLLGIWTARRRRPVALPLLGMAANVAALALHGSRTDIFIWHRYYIPSYFLAAVLAGMGAHAVVERLGTRARWPLLLLPVVALVVGYRAADRSRYRIAEDFSRTLLETLPPGAHLRAAEDNIVFVLTYLQLVEGLRPDVDLIPAGLGDADRVPLRFDPDRDPLFLTHHPGWQAPALEVVPVGLVFQAVRAGGPYPALRLPKRRLDGEDDPRVPKDYLTQILIGHFHYMIGLSHEVTDWATAQREFEEALRAAPTNDVIAYNVGILYRRNGRREDAARAFEASARVNPRRIPGSRQSAAELADEVRREMAASRTDAR
jgi:hypothetical protein